jgi:GNAT superfamily N-acetyltransferase
MEQTSIHALIERSVLRASPAVEEKLLGNWILRFSGGYSRPANAIYLNSEELDSDIEARIAACEQEYLQKGLSPLFRLSPFSASGFDAELEKHGYIVHEPTCHILKTDFTSISYHCDPDIYEVDLPSYIDYLFEFRELDEKYKDIERAILANIPEDAQQYYIVLRDKAGIPRSCGFGVLEGGCCGVFGLSTLPRYRGKGFGTRIMQDILRWGSKNSGTHAYLQVDISNLSANKVYYKVGFQQAYPYWYRYNPKHPQQHWE